MKRITVIIITYNQENVIRRTLDSVLQQKDWGLYRIIVNDDCSKDHTWDILQEYKDMYSNIVFPHRNNHNLGIYPNYQKVLSYLEDSDLYSFLSGDDEFCEGYFEGVQKCIDNQNINTDDAIGIYSDWKSVTPSGMEYVFKQNSVLSGNRLWSLKARGKITNRSLMFTRKVLDGFEQVLSGCGLNLTESHFDSQPHLNIAKAYYFPQVTSVYYSGIGVSTRLDLHNSDYLTDQVIEKWNYALKYYVKTDNDKYYAKYELMKADFYKKPKWRNIFKMLIYYIKGQLPGCKDTFKSYVSNFIYLVLYKVKNK